MKIRMLWSALAASSVLLVAGTALPGGPMATTNNELVDYNQQTGELWAYPSGQGLATYLHDGKTVHVAADLTHFLPPDPCFGLAHAWNNAVAWEDRNAGEKNHVAVKFVFEVLLTLMSNFQCRASVTSSTNGSPQPIVVIAPTSN
jgi:hypothetical protein